MHMQISAETSETECSRLNDAFSECEQSDKGIAYHFIELLLRRTDFDSRVNIVDCMQLLSGINEDSDIVLFPQLVGNK